MTPANCGSFSVTFFIKDEQKTALKSGLFKDFQDFSGNKFIVLQTQDVSKVGVYEITYKVAYTRYWNNFLEQTNPFTVTVVDLCAKNFSVASNGLTNKYCKIAHQTPAGIKFQELSIFSLQEFEVKETLAAKERTGKEPIPSLKGVNESGMLIVNWDKEMKIPANIDLIKSKQYVVMNDPTEAIQPVSGTRRALARRREWFDTNEQYLKYLLILEALEINIIASFEDGETKPVPFTWDLVVYSSFDIEIQLYFREEDMRNQQSQTNTVAVTFWGTEFFKSIDDHEVRVGEHIETVIRWQVFIQTQQMESIVNFARLTSWLVITIVAIMVLLLLILQKSLLPIWIMLISLQLIAHMALMSSMMPQEVVYFLRTILSTLRLQFTDIEIKNDAFYNPIFEMAGYSETLMSKNMSTAMAVLLCLFAISAGILCALDQLVFRKKILGFSKTFSTITASFTTFSVYFFGFCLLEVSLCAMIQIKASDSPAFAWFCLIVSYAPFSYAGTFLWKFEQRFNQPVLKVLSQPKQVIERKIDDETPKMSLELISRQTPTTEKVQHEGHIQEEIFQSQKLHMNSEIQEPQIFLVERVDSFRYLTPPLNSQIAYARNLKKKSNISHERSSNSMILIGNQSMLDSESVISKPDLAIGASIDENCAKDCQCLEGGSQDLQSQAKTKVSHECELKTKSLAMQTLLFGRKVSKFALVFNLTFAFRALTYCFVLVFGGGWPFPTQIISILASNTIHLCVVLDAGDSLWVSKMTRYQYIIDEMAVCIAIMFFYWFSEYVDDFALRQQIGKAFVGIIFLCVLINIGFLIMYVYQIIQRKLRVRRERLRQESLRRELLATTEEKSKIVENEPIRRKLSDWLNGSFNPSSIGEAYHRDHLQQTLQRKKKSSLVMPLPKSVSEHDSEYSLNSYRSEDGESYEKQQQQNIPLNENLVEKQEQRLPDIKRVNLVDLNEMIQNLDMDVSFDKDQDGLNCQKEDSQDLPIEISKLPSAELRNSNNQQSLYSYANEEDEASSPDLEEQDYCSASLQDQNNTTAPGDRTVGNQTLDQPDANAPNLRINAMGIAEELEIMPSIITVNQSDSKKVETKSKLSCKVLQQESHAQSHNMSFFKRLEEVENSLQEEQINVLKTQKVQHALNSLMMSNDLGPMQQELVTQSFDRFSKNPTKLDKALKCKDEAVKLDERFLQRDLGVDGKQGTCLSKRFDGAFLEEFSSRSEGSLREGQVYGSSGSIKQKNLTEHEKSKKEQPEADKIAPKKLQKAAKWAKKNQTGQKTVTVEIGSLPDKSIPRKSKKQKDLQRLKLTEIERKNNEQSSARIPLSSSQKNIARIFEERPSLRNRSQGELIMQQSSRVSKKNARHLIDFAKKSEEYFGSQQGIVGMQLMQARDPKISQREMFAFKDSSIGLWSKEEGASGYDSRNFNRAKPVSFVCNESDDDEDPYVGGFGASDTFYCDKEADVIQKQQVSKRRPQDSQVDLTTEFDL